MCSLKTLNSKFVQRDILIWLLSTRLPCTISHLLQLTTSFVTPSKADANYSDILSVCIIPFSIMSLIYWKAYSCNLQTVTSQILISFCCLCLGLTSDFSQTHSSIFFQVCLAFSACKPQRGCHQVQQSHSVVTPQIDPIVSQK